eukprot:15467504-Alexandrium_andersonii.AAC.1
MAAPEARPCEKGGRYRHTALGHRPGPHAQKPAARRHAGRVPSGPPGPGICPLPAHRARAYGGSSP